MTRNFRLLVNTEEDGDIPSSNIMTLVFLTIARANARIWRCPTERLLPPPATGLSNVTLPSDISLCKATRPAARRESFRVASSCSWKGSRFSLTEPFRSSGCTCCIRKWSLERAVSARTIWGMTVMEDRNLSKVSELVSILS